MSYIEELRNSRDKAIVAYQEFALLPKQNGDSLFCFFEGMKGSDNAYYVPRIKQYFNSVQPIKCGGREQVLKVHALITIHSEYNIYKKAYFIDRDFNQPLGGKNPAIYETPCYSIENLYVSHIVFSDIIKNYLLIPETDPIFQSILKLYIDRQREFHQAMVLFNAWYACLIDIKNSTGVQTGAILSNKPPNGFIDFSLSSIVSNYDLENIKEEFPNAVEVGDDNLSNKIKEFELCEQYKTFRGKFEMYFLVSILEFMIIDSVNGNFFIKKRIAVPFGNKLSNDQAITVFSGYAETPECLIDYLHKFLHI